MPLSPLLSSALFLASASFLAAPVPENADPPRGPEGRWHGSHFTPAEYGRHASRYTLTIDKGTLTVAGDGKRLLAGSVVVDRVKRTLTVVPTEGEAKGKTIPGTYTFYGEHLSWSFQLPGEEKSTWMFTPAWAGPPVKTTLRALGDTPEKFTGKLVVVEAVVAEEPHGSEVDARTTHGLDLLNPEGRNWPHFYIRCDGAPTVRKGDVARLTGRFTYKKDSFCPHSITAMDPDCKVERVVKTEKK